MSKKVVFYYVRHGETLYNKDHIIQGGRVDSELAPQAYPVLDETAQALNKIKLAACYCSPLPRAVASAKCLIQSLDLPIKKMDNLAEFDFGELDGKPYKRNRRAFVHCFMQQDFSEVGGETGEQVRRRARKAFKKMYQQAHSGDSILVVGHGAYLRSVLREFSEMTKTSRLLTSLTMRVPNGSITTIVGQNSEILVTQMPQRAKNFFPTFAG